MAGLYKTYDVIEAMDLEGFVRTVNKRKEEGWYTVGGVSVVAHTMQNDYTGDRLAAKVFWYCQAMERKEKEQDGDATEA